MKPTRHHIAAAATVAALGGLTAVAFASDDPEIRPASTPQPAATRSAAPGERETRREDRRADRRKHRRENRRADSAVTPVASPAAHERRRGEVEVEDHRGREGEVEVEDHHGGHGRGRGRGGDDD